MSHELKSFDSQLIEVIEELKDLDAYRTIDRLDEVEYDYDLTSNDYYGLADFDKEDLLTIIHNDSSYELQNELIVWHDTQVSHNGSTGSRLVSGNSFIVRQFEEKLSAQMSKSSSTPVECLYFNSGYHANTGIIPALAKLNPSTCVLGDQLLHASIVDGIKLSGADFIRFRHNDLDSLESKLQTLVNDYENIIIVTESIYHLDGEGIWNMKDLAIIKAKYEQDANIILYCDESHAIGLFGEYRLGRIEDEEVVHSFDIIVASLANAVNAHGAVVFVKPNLKAYLVNTCRSFIYTSALPPAVCHYADLALMALRAEESVEAAEELFEESAYLRNELIDAIKAHDNPIIASAAEELVLGHHLILSLMLGSSDAVLDARNYFAQRGIKISAIRFPTVGVGKERIRFSLQSSTFHESVEYIADQFRDFVKSDIFTESVLDYLSE